MHLLKVILKKQHKTSLWLAGELGVNEVTVSRWIHGLWHPAEAMLSRIAHALNTSPEKLGGHTTLTEEDERDRVSFRRHAAESRVLQKRNCLKCKEEFLSWGKGNRMCVVCRRKPEGDQLKW